MGPSVISISHLVGAIQRSNAIKLNEESVVKKSLEKVETSCVLGPLRGLQSKGMLFFASRLSTERVGEFVVLVF